MNLKTMFGTGGGGGFTTGLAKLPNYIGGGAVNPTGGGTGTADPGAGPFGPGGIIGTVKDMYGDSQKKTLDYLSGLTGDANDALYGGANSANQLIGQGLSASNNFYGQGLSGANSLLQQGMDQSKSEILQGLGKAEGSFGQGQGYLKNVMDQLPGMYSQSNSFFSNLMNNGMYRQGEIDSILGGAYQAANQASRTQGANLNQALAARGMGANPYAAAALGMQGQFAAQGARGRALADVTREQAGSRITGAQGHAANAQAQGGQMSGLSQAQAALAAQLAQTQMGAYGQIGQNTMYGYGQMGANTTNAYNNMAGNTANAYGQMGQNQFLAGQGASGNLMNQAGMGSQYMYGNNQNLAQLLSQLGLNMAGQATTPTSDATGGMLPTGGGTQPPNYINWDQATTRGY